MKYNTYNSLFTDRRSMVQNDQLIKQSCLSIPEDPR